MIKTSLTMALLLLATAAGATTVRRLSTDAMAGAAARIVHGVVDRVDEGYDEHGLASTWVTLAVTEAVKGDVGTRFTFKQYGVSAPRADGLVARVPGLPSYRAGAEVVVLLRGESSLGFTSPVGLGQGVYWVERRGGSALVRSAAGDATPTSLETMLGGLRLGGGWDR